MFSALKKVTAKIKVQISYFKKGEDHGFHPWMKLTQTVSSEASTKRNRGPWAMLVGICFFLFVILTITSNIASPNTSLAQTADAPRCVCVDYEVDGCACHETDTFSPDGSVHSASFGGVGVLCGTQQLADSFFNIANPVCGNNAEVLPGCSRIKNAPDNFLMCWGTSFALDPANDIPEETSWISLEREAYYQGPLGYVREIYTCKSSLYCCGAKDPENKNEPLCIDPPVEYGGCPSSGGPVPGSLADQTCRIELEPYYGVAESRLWFPHARLVHVLSTMAQTMFNPYQLNTMYEDTAFSKTSTQEDRDNGTSGQIDNRSGITARINNHQPGYNMTDNNSTAIVGNPVPEPLTPFYSDLFPGNQNACYVQETFSNPGDDLIGAKIKAEMLFTKQFTVSTKGMPQEPSPMKLDGGICTGDGGQFEIPYCYEGQMSQDTYGLEQAQYDCCSGHFTLEEWSMGDCINISSPDADYCLENYGTPANYHPYYCQSDPNCDGNDSYYCCSSETLPDVPGPCEPPDSITVTCDWAPFVPLSVSGNAIIYNKTPLIESINDTILQGKDSLFRRFMPDIEGIFELDDIPTKTNVQATVRVLDFDESLEHPSADVASFDLEYAKGQLSSPVMYIPHLGSLYQYWLIDFQKALKPLDLINVIYNQSPSGGATEECRGGSGVYKCDEYTPLTTGPCSVDNLEAVFLEIDPADPLAHDKACLASKICRRESGGVPTATNFGCTTHTSCDYSVGLFQYNYIIPDRCPGGITAYSCDPYIYCTIGNQDVLDDCEDFQSIPENAIQTMIRLSSVTREEDGETVTEAGVNWCPWQLESGCIVCHY